MLSSDKLIKLYTRYGFEQGPSSDQCLVFFSQKGYFQNAEIVLLNDDVKPEEIDKSEYAAVHDALFSGFFNTKISNNRLLREYFSFCKQQQDKLLGSKYEYARRYSRRSILEVLKPL